jgi:pyruvate ferredoxin oxidoreductase alpha subunit
VTAFTRISAKPIWLYCDSYDSEVAIILDNTLLKTVPVATELNQDDNYVAEQSNIDAVTAYPITSQTISVEKFSGYVTNDEAQIDFVYTKSEYSNMLTPLMVTLTDARTFTTSISADLVLMHEILFVTSDSQAPVMMAIANNALTSPITIHDYHSNSRAERDNNWLHVYVEEPQKKL